MTVCRASLVLLLPVLATACGSSSSPHASATPTLPTSSTALSVQDFVRAANAVCIKSDRRIFKLGRPTRDPSTWAKEAAAARVAMREMRAVTPPTSLALTFRRMVAYGQQLQSAIQTVHDQLAAKHYDKAVVAQFSAARLLDHVHSEAKLAGLTFCQQPLTDWPA